MTTRAVSELSDSELVAQFRNSAIERSKFRGLAKDNRIYEGEMAPAYEALAARGSNSLRTLLALVDDPNLDVRLDAAILVYDLDPQRCRGALRAVLKEKWLRPLATVLLLQKDPAFAAEFNRLAKAQDYDALERMIDGFAEATLSTSGGSDSHEQ